MSPASYRAAPPRGGSAHYTGREEAHEHHYCIIGFTSVRLESLGPGDAQGATPVPPPPRGTKADPGEPPCPSTPPPNSSSPSATSPSPPSGHSTGSPARPA